METVKKGVEWVCMRRHMACAYGKHSRGRGEGGKYVCMWCVEYVCKKVLGTSSTLRTFSQH